jgi:hypothetical protein
MSLQRPTPQPRLAYDDDKGQPVEEWIAAAIVVRAIPTGGRATAYDWHAVRVMLFRTLKGKLDSNDRLFKLIASTVRPDPEWQKWSNGIITDMYRKKQEELAKQSAIIAQIQQHAIDTITGVTARQQAGSLQSASGTSQIIRGSRPSAIRALAQADRVNPAISGECGLSRTG